ncbi:LuxR C-terminal-related transcriptional regulator [Embleya sp. AB8]|uniref:helix-turn-helix transcriptional regulator n=1 Tax=Embleya sp. AB8 TaxID=3156304 RepID=UPI003C721F07
MKSHGWTGPEDALGTVLDVLAAPLAGVLPRLSEVLAELVPHVALAQLSAVCAVAPVRVLGELSPAGAVTAADLGRVADTVSIGRPFLGEAVLAGEPRPVLAVAAGGGPEVAALLVLVRADTAPLPTRVLTLVQRMWDVVTVHLDRRGAEADPGPAAVSRAAAGARARTIAELTDTHSSVLSAILGTLRAPALDDAAARRRAIDLAVSALLDLRSAADRDRELSEEPADAAFARLTGELRPLLRFASIELDLRAPGTSRTLASDTAHLARAVVRAAVLRMLDQDSVHRLHVSWQAEGDELRIGVRDDGPGLLAAETMAVDRIAERLAALGGRLELDALPGWGTTVSATLPLTAPTPPAAPALDGLHPRELEVLEQLAAGRRNRDIARVLGIGESTVKFHVANILAKLGVGSRGEAAALVHRIAS